MDSIDYLLAKTSKLLFCQKRGLVLCLGISLPGFQAVCHRHVTTSGEGGTIASWRTADYLFSEDAACPDTVRIFQSKDYLWNKVTVFQSLFLSTCEKRQSVKSVCIGHYVLPPPSVQDEVRNVVGRLIWECEDEQGSRNHFSCQTDAEFSEEVSSSNCEPSVTDSSEGEAPLCGLFQDYPVSNMLTGYVSMDKMLKYSGDLCDFRPGCSQCSNMHYKESMFKKNK